MATSSAFGAKSVVSAFTPSALLSPPRPDPAASVKSMLCTAMMGLPRIPAVVASYRVCIMVRADHKEGGGKYHSAETPGSEDTDMIYHDLIFPLCISYGSTGSPGYTTDKVEVDSGAEQRNQRREYPKHEYNINMTNLPSSEISEIMNLWHVCAGDFIGFLFLDPLDHTSANTVDSLSGTDVSSADQLVSVAVGSQYSYELFKYYQRGDRKSKRRIRYPDLDTLVVQVGGYPITSWVYSYDEKVLTFTEPLALASATLSRSAAGVITGRNFSVLSPNDLVWVTGFSNAAYNAPMSGSPARVLTATSTTLTLQKWDGTSYGTAEFTDETVTISSALPPTGSEIRAGFYFYVPVRFEGGDNMQGEIKAGLRESTYANFSSITLREIFE